MNRRTKIWLGIGALAAVFIFAGILPRALKPKTLQDFEQRCMKTADPLKRQEIALAAVNFLVQQGVPDSIAQEIHQAAIAEKPAPTLESEWGMADSVAMNDSLWAVCESRLSQFLPALCHLKQSAGPNFGQTQLAMARNLAQKIDTYSRYDYWAPLLDFLNNADSTAWRRWRAAAISAGKSRDAYINDEFKLAKVYAICGLKNLSDIPDRRLYLDLCLRLQNAIAFDDACFSIALAFGEWITQECLQAKYYFRAASIGYNLGDQLYRIGRYDEAIEQLKNVLHLIARWHYIGGMKEWYRPWTHERISLNLREIGEYQTALSHLELFGQVAQSPREKALYYMGRGFAAQAQGDYEKSEQEYLKAIIAAKGDLNKGQEDLANVWYSHVNLAELFLEYNLPEKSLRYLEEGRFYAERKQKDFFNNERMSKYLLLKAQALIKKNDSKAAKETLRQAEQFLTLVNSSSLSIDDIVTTAALYESLNEIEEAGNHLKQAVNICRQRGLFLEEMRVILRQAELSMQVQTGGVKSAYPLEELYQVIAQLEKIGDKPQLIRAHALLAEAAYKVNQHEEARRQANLLLEQTEALSRQYEREERLTFFQHSIYKDIKSSIQIDILDGRLDSAFVKLGYVKGRALRGKLLGSRMPYLDIAAVQKNLQNNEAILDYMITADTLYAFVLTRSALQLRRIPVNKQHLQAKVDLYISYLKDDQPFRAANNERHFRELFSKGIQLSNELYQAIFEKIAPALKGASRLFIIPDEFLYAVPFNTLALKDTIDTRFLIEEKAILMLPGAWMLTTQLDGKKAQEEVGFLASIDPSMPGAEKIEKRLRTMFGNGVDTRTRWEDKKSFKKHLATGYATYLFYAHAEANWDEPRESYIELPINSPNDKGRLSYQDIDSLDWRKTMLVILAGCETSGNRIYLGAGLAGLQRAFLAAGANQVLATYWKVDAMQVAGQIPRFLETWNQHHDALLALQSMQKMSIEELKNDPFFKFPHLQLWGAYNLTGAKSSVGDTINLAMN